jgi:replicative DNA helicase
MSWKAKQIAKRNNVPVLLLSQLSRQVESRPNKQPQLSDLRYSGAIEQDADMVIFPWNSEEYDMVDEQGQYYAQIEIAKYRNGKTAMITDLEMVGQHQLWKEKEGGFISGGEVKF